MGNRMLRDWTDSDKINKVSVHAERFFTRLIMKADDYGCFHANPSLLKANLFPLLLDSIREADLIRWMAECQKAGLIVLYESKSKKYLQILDFRQRLDKARAKFPFPQNSDLQPVNNFRELDNEFPAERELELETELETEKANASFGAAKKNELEKYKSVEKDMNAIADFIIQEKPLIVDPYKDLWNLFAEKHNRPQITNISDKRRKKLLVRIGEPAFDFVKVLKKARISDFLLSGNFFSFDWVIENPGNYLKVLEGNYDNKTQTFKPNGNNQKSAASTQQLTGIDYSAGL